MYMYIYVAKHNLFTSYWDALCFGQPGYIHFGFES